MKTATKFRKNTSTTGDEEKEDRRNNIVIPYVSGVSKKLRRIFNKDRNWSTLKTTHPNTSKATLCMQSNAVRNAQICTLVKPNNH